MLLHHIPTALIPGEVAIAVRQAIHALHELIKTAQMHIDEQTAQAIDLGFDEQERLEHANPQQWLDQGKHSLQAGMMFIDRALQQPTEF